MEWDRDEHLQFHGLPVQQRGIELPLRKRNRSVMVEHRIEAFHHLNPGHHPVHTDDRNQNHCALNPLLNLRWRIFGIDRVDRKRRDDLVAFPHFLAERLGEIQDPAPARTRQVRHVHEQRMNAPRPEDLVGQVVRNNSALRSRFSRAASGQSLAR